MKNLNCLIPVSRAFVISDIELTSDPDIGRNFLIPRCAEVKLRRSQAPISLSKTFKIAAILLFVTLLNIQNASAQDQAGTFLRSGADDGNKLINAYLSPLVNGFGQGVNDGWYNTAKPLGIGGFDFRIILGASHVPSGDQSYNINNLGLNTDPAKPRLVLPSGTDPNLPTVFGANSSTPTAQIRANVVTPSGTRDTAISSLTLPSGSGFAFTPSIPMIQLGAGLYKNTEITFRFFPQTQIGNFKMGLFGFGVKHDIKQWIPAIKEQPWDLSVFFGYTSFATEYATKTLLSVDASAYNPDPSVAYNNQKITLGGSAYTFGMMVSKKILFFTPYAGFNYARSKMSLKFEGDYPIPVPNDQINATHPQVTKISKATDPIDIEPPALSSFRLNAGCRLKFTLVTISAEYSFAFGGYNSASLGIGLNLQSIVPFKM